MKLTFLGAAGTVTGSKYLLTAGQQKVLVDCGLFQGYKELRLRNWSNLPVVPQELAAVVLTHAHIDHSGYLPLLVKNGFRGAVYCSEATRDLCRILLPDSGYLQEEEANYANRHGFSKHRPALPLYTYDDAQRSLEYLVPIANDRDVALADGIRLRLRRAGHLLGASLVELRAEGTSVLFSGDLGRPNDLLTLAPSSVAQADYLLVESTYGDRLHDASDPREQLATVINRTAARGGAVLVPAFAVGRAQMLLHLIGLLKAARTIPDVPVYLNSPMAIDATLLFNRHRDEHRLTPAQCAALQTTATMVRSVEESKRLNELRGPMVIISASGMAAGGRVVHHLKSLAPDERNTILFAGYQAGGTRGAAIVNGATTIKIHGEQVPVRAEVVSMSNISAHADYAEILDWLAGFRSAPKRTFVVHGEPGPADALRRRIEETLRWRVAVPEYHETVELR